MSGTIRLTAAQAMMLWLSVQKTEDGERFIEGVWAIFGHGNVAGIGEALHRIGDALPTWRGQNEQTMAHAAIAYAKTKRRRRAQAVTSSIGPGATNMVTAAALAHVNRLPVLHPRRRFGNRRPDPVLQQIEDFDDGTISVNDCFKPVTRYFDRISRPEHLLTALPRAMRTLTDPADCGPVCLAFCQDVQAEAFDYPESFFEPKVWRIRRPEPDPREVADVVAAIRSAKNPVIVAGGGVLYSGAEDLLADFAATQHPLRRDPGWQGRPELGACDELRLAGGHRLCLRQRCVRGGRPRNRRRHPLPGLHDRQLVTVPQPRAKTRQHQLARLRRAEAWRDRCGRRRQGNAGTDRCCARQPAVRRSRRQGAHRLARGGSKGHRGAGEGQERAAQRRAGDRRGAAGPKQKVQGDVRRRHDAGRAAGATDVPVDAFWSVIVHDTTGHLKNNEYDAYPLNNITDGKNPDGSVAVQFGGCDARFLTACRPCRGGNMVRLYRPRTEILYGSWKFPEPQPAS